MYFIPLRVSKERTLSVVGGKGAVSRDKRERGGGEQEMGTKLGTGVRSAGYGRHNIPTHQFIY